VGKLVGDVSSMRGPADDDGPLGRNEAPEPVQGLSKERGWTQQRDVLFGAVDAEELPDQRSQPTPVATGEHDGPDLG